MQLLADHPLDSDTSANTVTVPGLIGEGLNSIYNWNITTTPQEFLDNNARPFLQGHAVGGGSVVNGLVVTRGAKADYDAWEELGNTGWNWDGLLPYFKKVSSSTKIHTHHQT
jgi:choline dehydrogenase